MYGPEIIVRSMAAQQIEDKHGNRWQYNPWSDSHSKISCWSLLFDLLLNCPLLVQHVTNRKVGFGINHTMVNFLTNRPKNLDLVIAVPRESTGSRPLTFVDLASQYGIRLNAVERAALLQLPTFYNLPVGDVVLALEAKACMTAHQKAGPRLYDELTSAWGCMNGGAPNAVAVGLAMLNASPDFISPRVSANQRLLTPGQAVWNHDKQPKSVVGAQNRVRTVTVRGHVTQQGYDAVGILTILAKNDGSPITLAPTPPALPSTDGLHYERMILRAAGLYNMRFAAL